MRHRAIGNVLATLRIEQLAPSDFVVQGMQACLDGRETTAKLREEVMRRHVALRRV
ncbi:hypothetical protein MASR1M60_33130 [Rhodocyclaceae bacterium]